MPCSFTSCVYTQLSWMILSIWCTRSIRSLSFTSVPCFSYILSYAGLSQPVSLHEHHWPFVTTESWKSGSGDATQSHRAMSNFEYPVFVAGSHLSSVSIAYAALESPPLCSVTLTPAFAKPSWTIENVRSPLKSRLFGKIGRASCRERVEISEVARSL